MGAEPPTSDHVAAGEKENGGSHVPVDGGALFVLKSRGNYFQPTNEVFEKKFTDPNKIQFSIRNIVPRLISWSLSVVVATIFVGAMFPFFRDLMALLGAFGCIPIDFIMAMVFYNATFKLSKGSPCFLGKQFDCDNFFGVGGHWGVGFHSTSCSVGDAKTYTLFANM